MISFFCGSVNPIVYVDHIFFIPSPVEVHLSCFCVLAAVYTAAVGAAVEVFLHTRESTDGMPVTLQVSPQSQA